jgi:UDP-2,3-diacylglucosamine pyrophosphatase LpxH
MIRTQIYLLESQKVELDKLALQKNESLAEVIREAVNLYIAGNHDTAIDLIQQTHGLWKNRDDINSDDFISRLREDDNARLEEGAE